VQVVSYQRAATDAYLTHQSHPSANSLLKQFDVRKVPARTPELRLPAESENSRI
jgi:hypothetical protein